MIDLPGQGAAFVAASTAFVVDIVLSVIVSLVTEPKPASELKGLVYSETPREDLIDPDEAARPCNAAHHPARRALAGDGHHPQRRLLRGTTMSDGTSRTGTHQAGVFDIRNIIAALLGLYGVILTLAGLLGEHEPDMTRGVNANLWDGPASSWPGRSCSGPGCDRSRCPRTRTRPTTSRSADGARDPPLGPLGRRRGGRHRRVGLAAGGARLGGPTGALVAGRPTAPTCSSSAPTTRSTSRTTGCGRASTTSPSRSRTGDLLYRIRLKSSAHGWHELFADRYPHAGGDGHTALYLESSEGFARSKSSPATEVGPAEPGPH